MTRRPAQAAASVIKDPVIGYNVCIRIVVDHPELRSSTFRPVPPDTCLYDTRFTTELANAESAVRGLMAGEDDFVSEYVYEVSIERLYAHKPAEVARRPMRRLSRSGAWAEVAR